MKCPRCNQSVEKLQTEYGLALMCQSCFGHFLHEKNIFKYIPIEKWNKTLSYSKNPSDKKRITCPSCKSLMDTHDLPEEYNFIQIDRCAKCKVIWFDKDKIEDLNLRSSIQTNSKANSKNVDQLAQGILLDIKLDHKKKELHRMRKELERTGVNQDAFDNETGLYDAIIDIFD